MSAVAPSAPAARRALAEGLELVEGRMVALRTAQRARAGAARAAVTGPAQRTLAPAERTLAPAERTLAPAERADAPASRSDAASGAARRDPLRLAARLAPVLGLGLCIGLVVWGMQSGVLRSLEHLQQFIDALGLWGPAVFVGASLASTVFPVVPGGLLVIAAPLLFGPVEGTLYSYLAISAGSMLNFAIGRQLGLGLIERVFSPRTVEKYLGWTRGGHFARAFATAIVLPVAPDDLLCYLAGTTRMRWRTFALIILAGKPWTLLAYGLGVSTLLTRFWPW